MISRTAIERDRYRLAIKTVKSFEAKDLGLMIFKAKTLIRADALLLFGVHPETIISVWKEKLVKQEWWDSDWRRGYVPKIEKECLLENIPGEVFTFHCKQDLVTKEIVSDANDVQLPDRCKVHWPALEVGESYLLHYVGVIKSAVFFGAEALR